MSGIPQYAMLDVWMALGGDSTDFDKWIADDPRRTDADSWAQLMGAIQGDLMTGDTNPPPGAILKLVWKRWPGSGESPEAPQ